MLVSQNGLVASDILLVKYYISASEIEHSVQGIRRGIPCGKEAGA